jgi:Tfp pilus assembly protein PilN
MAQQINLCTAALTPRRQRYQAKFLLQVLGACLLLLGAVAAFWSWSLERSAQGLRQTLAAQASEILNLQSAIERARATTGPLEPALLQELQEKRRTVQERQQVLQAMSLGQFKAGAGHSDRLLLLARSIPADVWVSSLHADSANFEVAGFTLEPASLNAWVERLGQQPLLLGLQLGAVKLDYVAQAAPAPVGAGAAAAASAPVAKPRWSFSLHSQAQPPGAAAVPIPGAKP